VTGFFNTIILLGAIQGFIVSILLFRRRKHRQSEKLLGFLILLMSMASINLYFYNTGIFDSTDVLRIIAAVVPLVIVMPMGPLIYFYIQSISDPSFSLTRTHKFQFYTSIIDIVPQITALIYIDGVLLRLLKPDPQPWGIFIDTYNIYADIPRWLSVTIYVWLSYKYIRNEKNTAAADPQKMAKLKWLQLFITVFLVFQSVWFVYLVPYVIPAYSNRLLDLVDWYPVYIPLAVMIYWLGIKGYLFTYTIPDVKKKAIASQLSDHIVSATATSLKKVMETDKIYLNPILNLEMVAAQTGIPAKTISGVLNQHLQQNFAEWVNSYRIAEFKQRAHQERLEQLTISAIASECGFSSQATFQRIFKQYLGMTPSEYLKKAESGS
jgi:AraC-like DNA-binding protein